MSSKLSVAGLYIMAVLATLIGLYPIMYFTGAMDGGLLASKPPDLLDSFNWQFAFKGHILFGGIALLAGWSQFFENLRRKYVQLHRRLGLVYIISVLISGFCALGLAMHATGGWITGLGFGFLAVFWIGTTATAFLYIKRRDLIRHRAFMILSYGLCLAAVSLRIWLPLLSSVLGDFLIAYKIVAWLCWVPNLAVALWIAFPIRKTDHNM